MNSVQRLKWFEEKLTAILRDRLHFEHFEVRLLSSAITPDVVAAFVGIRFP